MTFWTSLEDKSTDVECLNKFEEWELGNFDSELISIGLAFPNGLSVKYSIWCSRDWESIFEQDILFHLVSVYLNVTFINFLL